MTTKVGPRRCPSLEVQPALVTEALTRRLRGWGGNRARRKFATLVLQLSLVTSDSSYLWEDCMEVSHVGRLCKRPCLA